MTQEEKSQDSRRAPFKMTREQFDNIFTLHELQPWTKRKHTELYALLQECTTAESFHLVVKLLSDYTNFDETRAGNAFEAMQNKIVEDWKLKPEDTLIVAMHDKSDASSAQAILQSFKACFSGTNYKPNNFICHLKPALTSLKKGMNVVFVDDFIGTGSQFCEQYDWFSDELGKQGVEPVGVYLVALCIMEQAIEKLNGRGVTHYAHVYMRKGITDEYPSAERKAAIDLMHQLENNLMWKNPSQRTKYSLGFLQSEALFRYMENNAPNNNFPIFWWSDAANGRRRKTMQVRFS